MTNHWIDIKNADCILIMGSNAAANHPISFKWIYRAMEAGATLISVDPRYNRPLHRQMFTPGSARERISLFWGG